jgi:6,7-dimethyl-8-ribityllumazine synthase
MATSGKHLSAYNPETVPNGVPFRIAIAVGEWNYNITGNLLKGAEETLLKHGVLSENLIVAHVPGAFELPLAAQQLIESQKPDAVITIGCVIQGETKHFDFVCDGVTQGVMEVSLKYNTPVIFCVLTDNTLQQSIDRSGGKHGNKGIESAVAALKMAALKQNLKRS